MLKKQKKDTIVAILIPVLLVLFAQIQAIPLVVVAYILALIYIANPFVLFPASFVTSLSTDYFVLVPGLSNGLIFTTLLIVALFIRGLRTHSLRNNHILEWVVVLIGYNFFSSAFSITGDFSTFVIMLENLIVLYLMSLQKDVDIDHLATTLSITSFVVILMLLWSLQSGMMLETDSGRFTAEGVNENRFAMICSQLCAVLIFSVFYMRNKVFRLLGLLGFLASVYLLLLAGSRSALLGGMAAVLATVLSFEFYSGKRSKLRPHGKMLVPFIMLVVAIYIGINMLMDSDLAVLDRFKMENVIEGRGTHRIDRAEYLLNNIFPDHSLFGIGLGGLNEYAVSPGPCHNIILDPIIQLGLIGAIMYWVFIIPLIKRAYKKLKTYNVVIILPLSLFFAGFFNGMGEIVFTEKLFWNAIALCVLFVNNLQSPFKEFKAKDYTLPRRV